MNYKDRLKQIPQQLEEAQLDHTLTSARLQLDSDISATTLELSKSNQRLNASYLVTPFSAQTIINAKNDVKKLEAGLKQLNELKDELFPHQLQAK